MQSESTMPLSPIDEERVRCEWCDAALANPAELHEHLQGHPESRVENFPPLRSWRHYKCAFCGVQLDSADELKIHYAGTHWK
jgi:hypothetical protein